MRPSGNNQNYMSWFEGKKKWIAGAAAALGLGIAAEKGLNRGSERPKPRDAGVRRENNDMADTRRDAPQKINEKGKDKSIEEYTRVKAGIDAMFKSPEKLTDDAAFKKLTDFMHQIFPDYRVEKLLSPRSIKRLPDGTIEHVPLFQVLGEFNKDGSFASVAVDVLADGNYRVDSVTGWDVPVVASPDELKDIIAKKIQIDQMANDAINTANDGKLTESIYKQIESFARENGMGREPEKDANMSNAEDEN